MTTGAWDVEAIRRHFVFPRIGRIATNNAASTQPPRELLDLYRTLAPQYENVHRGQSSASMHTTRLFEAAYDDIARFVGAKSRNNIVVVRNTTEAINAVMYSLMGIDYLAFSFHKMLAPFGVGVLVAKAHLLEASAPFLYGGDMIAEGQVFPDRVAYNALPWKYAAGTPNILGTIVSAQALRLLIDLATTPKRANLFGSERPIERAAVDDAMDRVTAWNQRLTAHALDRLGSIDGITIYGPKDAAKRSSLVAFNVKGRDPMALARALNEAGIESRAGCHCATLAHRALGLDPPASCRLSFYLYNTLAEVDRATDALADIVAGRRRRPTIWERLRTQLRRRLLAPVHPSFDRSIHPITHLEIGEPS
jgi:selenocysteine lyase/cysteine desulfurase